MHTALQCSLQLLVLLAPIVPHTAEDAWQLLPYHGQLAAKSVFEAGSASVWSKAEMASGRIV